MHLTFCGRIFKHTILKVQYTKKRNTNSKEQAELQEICGNSMSLWPFLPKPSPHTVPTIYVQEGTSLDPKINSNNTIFLFQMCDTFDRTTKGRSWLASQDHPDYTQFIWSSSMEKHFIDSQNMNYLKYKAVASGRNSHSVSVKPSIT